MTPFNTYGGGWMVVGVKKNSLEIYNNIHQGGRKNRRTGDINLCGFLLSKTKAAFAFEVRRVTLINPRWRLQGSGV